MGHDRKRVNNTIPLISVSMVNVYRSDDNELYVLHHLSLAPLQ